MQQWLILKIFLLLNFVPSQEADILRVYRTFRSRFNLNDHTCIYDMRTNALRPYCFRTAYMEDENAQDDKLSCNDQQFTFQNLRDDGITGLELWNYNTPVDVIDAYQTFLDLNITTTTHTNVFCNCTNPLTFGVNCEYMTKLLETKTEFEEQLLDEISHEQSQSYVVDDGSSDIASVTRYVDPIRPCTDERGTIVCLQWSNICDGE